MRMFTLLSFLCLATVAAAAPPAPAWRDALPDVTLTPAPGGGGLVATAPGAGPERLARSGDLRRFFRAHIRPIRSEADARTAVVAWLEASAGISGRPGGLAIDPATILVAPLPGGGFKAQGRARPADNSGGGSSETSVALAFDAAGRLVSSAESSASASARTR